MESVLIAIGGNALYDRQSGENLSVERLTEVCSRIVTVCQQGYLPLITFGNGPQVGNLLDMAETSVRTFGTSVTLDACVSWTQGEIGYRLSRELTRQFTVLGLERPVIALNTQVEVSPDDPAFMEPSKPVGRFISAEEAQRLYEERGWIIGPDANRGYRRRVPSPRPIRILEADAIRGLMDTGWIVLCCGGGGIPVYRRDGVLHGIEAVIDKDFTSCLLARTLKIENLIICTEVENAYLRFGTPEQTALRHLTLADAERYLAEGEFGAGSMGPKMAAMVDYVREGGGRAMITSLERMVAALEGRAGTEIRSGSF